MGSAKDVDEESGGAKQQRAKPVPRRTETKAPEIKEVTLADISFDDAVITRSALNKQAIKEYREKYARQIAETLEPHEQPFPLPDLFEDAEGNLWPANGLHRITSLMEEGVQVWKCNVHLGTRADAIAFAVSSDRDVGVRRTNADKRIAVIRVLAEASLRVNSNGVIGAMCGVDEKLVRQERDRLYPEEKGKATKGKDGKLRKRPQASVGSGNSETKAKPPPTPPPTPPTETTTNPPPASTGDSLVTPGDHAGGGSAAANDSTSVDPRLDATQEPTTPAAAGTDTAGATLPNQPETLRQTFRASNGASLSLLVVHAASRKRSSIVIAGTSQADIDRMSGVIERAKALGMDLTVPRGDALHLLALGLDEREREDKFQKDLFAETMTDEAAAGAGGPSNPSAPAPVAPLG